MPKLNSRPPSGFAGVIFGPPGAGKTSLCASLPADKTIYVEIEGGSGPLRDRGWNPECCIPTKPSQANPNAFKNDLDALINMLRFTHHNYEYVVIDSASEIEKYFQLALCYVAGKPITSLKEYGGGADLMYKAAVELRDLKEAENNKCGRAVNVIFIAGEFPLPITRTENEELTMLYPLLTKKMAIKFAHLLDFQARLEVRSSDNTRFLRFEPTERVAAKCRYDRLKNTPNIGPNFSFYEQICRKILDYKSNDVAPPKAKAAPTTNTQPAPGKTGRIG